MGGRLVGILVYVWDEGVWGVLVCLRHLEMCCRFNSSGCITLIRSEMFRERRLQTLTSGSLVSSLNMLINFLVSSEITVVSDGLESNGMAVLMQPNSPPMPFIPKAKPNIKIKSNLFFKPNSTVLH